MSIAPLGSGGSQQPAGCGTPVGCDAPDGEQPAGPPTPGRTVPRRPGNLPHHDGHLPVRGGGPGPQHAHGHHGAHHHHPHRGHAWLGLATSRPGAGRPGVAGGGAQLAHEHAALQPSPQGQATTAERGVMRRLLAMFGGAQAQQDPHVHEQGHAPAPGTAEAFEELAAGLQPPRPETDLPDRGMVLPTLLPLPAPEGEAPPPGMPGLFLAGEDAEAPSMTDLTEGVIVPMVPATFIGARGGEGPLSARLSRRTRAVLRRRTALLLGALVVAPTVATFVMWLAGR